MKIQNRKIQSIRLNQIDQTENSRLRMKDIAMLMSSIRSTGLIQPIGVKKGRKKKYEIVFGNRRLEAVRKLGWTTIDAEVVSAGTKESRVINLAENTSRVNLTVDEIGRYVNELKKDGLNNGEISAKTGLSFRDISLALSCWTKVPEKFRKEITFSNKPGVKTKFMSPSTAVELGVHARSMRLTKKETEKLFVKASKANVNFETIRNLKKDGRTLKKKDIFDYHAYHAHVLLKVTSVERFITKKGKPLNALLNDALKRDPDFKSLF